MKAVTKITFYDEQDEKFFGEGPCRLLHAIEAEGSLLSLIHISEPTRRS